MIAGDVPGLWTVELEVPVSGVLEFHFLQDGEEDQVLCPASAYCRRKTETIVGPDPEMPVNNWIIEGAPMQDVQIELFIQKGMRTSLWLMPNSGSRRFFAPSDYVETHRLLGDRLLGDAEG